MNEIKFEKISWEQYLKDRPTATKEEWESIKLPTRSTSGSAGYDFYLPYDVSIIPSSTMPYQIVTGIKAKMPRNIALFIMPRSSLGSKYGMQLANTIGLIDSDYYNNDGNEGHIMARFIEHSVASRINLKAGDRFIQGVFIPFFTTDEDMTIATRVGGFGSTNGNL